MSKGIKVCPSCSKGVGCRSFRCPCGHEFLSNKIVRSVLQRPKGKKNRKWKRVLDWRELKKGDKVKVVGGGMSYSNQDNTTHYRFGYRGTFVISRLDGTGIHASQNEREGVNCHCFLRMVVNSPINPNLPGVTVRPYRLRKWVGGV